MSTQMESQSQNKKNKNKSPQVPSVKAYWDGKSNEVFITLCVEQVKAGHRPGTHLDRIGWEAVVNKFKIMTGKAYNRLQMKNHWDILKKDWGLWKNLLRGESGLGRDTLTGAITASEEWWKNKLERYPDAAKFRRVPLQFAEELDILFSDVAATGEWAYTPSSGVMPGTDDTQEEFHTPVDGEFEDNGADLEVLHPSELNKRRASNEGSSNKRKTKRVSGANLLSKTLDRIANVVESSSAHSTQNVSRFPSIGECLEKLASIPGVTPEDDIYVWAARLFLRDKRRECFMTLPTDEVRLRFLNLEIDMEKSTISGYRG